MGVAPLARGSTSTPHPNPADYGCNFGFSTPQLTSKTDDSAHAMMQSVLEINPSFRVREFFRRPQQTPSLPFQQVDRRSSRTSPQPVPRRSHRKTASAASKETHSPFNQFCQSRDLAPVHYPVAGSNLVEEIYYTEPFPTVVKGRIWINQTQYFDSVSPAVWNLVLGGRQICQKWLQERQGCILCEKSIQHYQQMLTILKDMVDLMSGIDTVMQKQQSDKKNLPSQQDVTTTSHYTQPELVMSGS